MLIRLACQTAWEAVRNNFMENKEKMASKDYELHDSCELSQQLMLYFDSFLAFANTVEYYTLTLKHNSTKFRSNKFVLSLLGKLPLNPDRTKQSSQYTIDYIL